MLTIKNIKNMKPLFSTLITAALLLTLSGCSESDFSDLYADPSKTSTVSCDKLMTGVFFTGKTFTTQEYWRVFTFDYGFLGRCTQTVGFVNSAGRYGIAESYSKDRWTHFYWTFAQYRLLEDTYSKLPDDNKPDYEISLLLSQIFIYEQLQEIIDLYGDVPFSQAGMLALTGDVESAHPEYDKAEALYEKMLDDLDVVNTKLAAYTPTSLSSAYLPAQDYINKGDVAKWRKFANSLRLRMAMRVADHGSLATKGRQILSAMLADPTKYPVVDNNGNNGEGNIKIDPVPGNADFEVTKDTDTGIQGIEAWNGQVNRASKAMVDALQNDPRLPVIYDPNSEGKYVGMATDESETDQKNNLLTTRADGIYYSSIDTSTISRNASYPGVLISAAEVSFIKAEAFHKSYATGDPKAAFITGVKQSIEFYYWLNRLGTYRAPLTPPSESDVTAFAEQKWDAYSTKEEAIGTQKWLHLSLIDMIEAWGQMRRTGIPALSHPTDALSPAYPNVVDRLRYPSDEKDNNSEKYAAYQSNDSNYRKLFWAKP
jgi:hypothetical protein